MEEQLKELKTIVDKLENETYVVLENDEKTILISIIQMLLLKGWQPLGGMQVVCTNHSLYKPEMLYMQTMIKPNKKIK